MNKFEKYNCNLKNEDECEEELDSEGIDFENEEAEMFGE